jgi:hypothetical protein
MSGPADGSSRLISVAIACQQRSPLPRKRCCFAGAAAVRISARARRLRYGSEVVRQLMRP